MENNLRDKYGRLIALLEIYGPSMCGANYVKFYSYEKIPKKKLQGALNSYAKGVKAESVIGLFDVTLFGGAKEGILFTTAGMYFDEMMETKFHINYVDIDRIVITDSKDKDRDTKIDIELKDGKILKNVTSVAYNKTPLMNYLKAAKGLAEEGYAAETDSFIDYISSDIPEEYKVSCHKIIHSAASSAALPAAGLAQIPLSDTVLITPIQITMIIALGEVFNIRIGESTAKSILAGATASLAGRSLSQLLVGWVPGYGNAINATTAFATTEAIGWMAADHFYKIKLEEDNKTIDALRKVDNAHEEKHRQQAEYFESQKREWEKIRDEYEDIIQEYENK